MKTIGVFIKNARVAKKTSLDRLSQETKIKKTFLMAIENEEWDKLPTYPVVLGFVRSIADSIEVSTESALALLRRDYPPKKEKISPSPDIENKVFWSPKLTFLAGVIVFSGALIIYLVFQYYKFISPPEIIIFKPTQNEVLIDSKVEVSGKTDTDSVLTINNQPVVLDQDGNFSVEIEVTSETKELSVKAVSRSKKETVKVIPILLDL